jgi:fungal type III polyketide synthase
MLKTLAINKKTGIDRRPVLCDLKHPFYHDTVPHGPTIDKISDFFRTNAVPLAAGASRQALADAGVTAQDITHVVCTTVTDSSNPGYDVELVRELGISANGVERYLIAGVGCAGGLSALRTATNIALGAHACGRVPVVLICATEVVSPFANMELNRVRDGYVNVAPTLFSDCSSALVLTLRPVDQVPAAVSTSGEEATSPASATSSPVTTASELSSIVDGPVSAAPEKNAVYSLVGFTTWTVPDTTALLRYDVNPHGWAAIVTPKLPLATASAVAPTYKSLMKGLGLGHLKPTDVDWAVHPGGAAILSSCGSTMGLDMADHLRASWAVYKHRGNSSSATVLSVLQALRSGKHVADLLGAGAAPNAEDGQPREYVIAVAFGPGVLVEMALLRRTGWESS